MVIDMRRCILTDSFCRLLLNGIHDDTHADFLNDCCDFIFTFLVKIILTDPLFFFFVFRPYDKWFSFLNFALFTFFVNYFKIFFFYFKIEKKNNNKKKQFFVCFLLQEYSIFGHDLIFFKNYFIFRNFLNKKSCFFTLAALQTV